jgi:hypothetical protein
VKHAHEGKVPNLHDDVVDLLVNQRGGVAVLGVDVVRHHFDAAALANNRM